MNAKNLTEWDIARKALADAGFTPEESNRTFAELACEANPLFAAAPELLEACRLMAECSPMQQGERNGAIMGMISKAIDAARAAIAKATQP